MEPWRLFDKQIFVHRPNLENIPELGLAEGYRVCPNSDELLPEWVGLLDAVFGDYTIERVKPQLESELWDVDRIKLVAKDDELVALSMAWHEPALWPHSGFVFWVAVAEAHQGHGLGSFVLCQALRHIAQEGLRDAITYTEEFRLPAIRMYLRYGFHPLITGTAADERERWERAFAQLGEPELMRTVRSNYAEVAGEKIRNSWMP